jgi:hypothetical protein
VPGEALTSLGPVAARGRPPAQVSDFVVQLRGLSAAQGDPDGEATALILMAKCQVPRVPASLCVSLCISVCLCVSLCVSVCPCVSLCGYASGCLVCGGQACGWVGGWVRVRVAAALATVLMAECRGPCLCVAAWLLVFVCPCVYVSVCLRGCLSCASETLW